MVWGGRWEGGSGLGTHVHPWRIHVNVWQNQYSIVKLNKVKIKKIFLKKEGTGNGERKRYTQLNAEFHRMARRDKKTSLSELCKEIEENNGIGKARDLFKKIEDMKGIF